MKTSRKWIAPLLVAAALGSFVWGTTQLLLLRFERGDVYPPYSTLRSDPVGAKAFYESLDECRGISAERNYRHLGKLEGGPDKALFILGASPGEVSFSLTRDLDAFVRRGGRLVVTFVPMAEQSFELQKQRLKKKIQAKKGAQPSEKKDQDEEEENKSEEGQGKKHEAVEYDDNIFLFAPGAWGFEFKHSRLADPVQGTKAFLKQSPLDARLPEWVSCHTSLYFDKLDDSWSVLYERGGGRALVIERRLNKGTIVLSSLTYFVSNEAMKQERHPDLLAWLVRDRKRLIFDEYHHAVAEVPGIATLGRKYRLHGLFAGIVLLAFLFVWKSAAGSVPLREDPEDDFSLAAGKDSAAGLANLLRRNIPLSGLVRTCLGEWKKSLAHGRADVTGKIPRMEAQIAAAEKDPLYAAKLETTYNELCEILTERK